MSKTTKRVTSTLGRSLAYVLVVLGKGGDAKTTTTASLGDALAREGGLSVLLVDLDTQVSLTSWLHGLEPQVGVDSFLAGEVQNLADVIVTVRETSPDAPGRVDLAPATRDIADLDPSSLGQAMHRLRRQASELGYDAVILDTHSFSPQGDDVTMHLPAIAVSDGVLLAFQPSNMSYLALVNLVDDLRQIAIGLKKPDLPLHIMPTKSARTVAAFTAIEQIQQHWPESILGVVRHAVVADNAVGAGVLLHEFAPSAKPSLDYLSNAREMLTRIGAPTA